MSTPLLLTKFNIPATGAKLVHRPRLLRILDESLDENTSLVLVCGPAGYGKTTIVSEWLHTSPEVHPGHFTWLTLESGDDDLNRFLTYFITALQRIRPDFGEGVLSMLQTHKPQPLQALATLLINELSDFPERIFLILDDYHLLTAQPIQSFMTFLVDHQPPQLCLVLLTRTDPPLPLARLRARGQLVELRQNALCFLPAEVAEFTGQTMELVLSPEQVSFLAKQTEGWVSGLQLAAIALRQVQDRATFFQSFSGEHEFIADYLTEEVLARLPEPVRSFLLHTSILERLTAPLCEAVTGQTGAQAIIQYLMAANLFIVPLDDRQEWFRYHILFADLLRKRITDVAGGQIRELHHRASCWFAENGLVDRAIEHAIAGEDGEQAARLIEQVAESLLMRGQAATLLRWMDALPKEMVLSHPVLVPLEGFAMILCGRSPQQAVSLFQESAATGNLEKFFGEVTTLQAMLAVLQGKPAEAIQLSEQAIRHLPAERVFFRSLAVDSLGMAYTMAGDFEAGARAFEQVAEIAMQSDNVMMALMALSNLAGLHYIQGQLHTAISTCRQVVELASQRIGKQTPMLGKAYFNLGEMLREQGDLHAALGYLLESAGMMENFSEIGLPLVYIAIARIYINQHDWPAAQSYIDQARQRAQASQSTWMDDRLVEVVQARYWIARGELDQAVQWARGRGLLDRTLAEIFSEADRNSAILELLQGESLTLVRLTLAQGQHERALEMLSVFQDMVGKRSHLRRRIEILALKALALHQKGEIDQAMLIVGEALALAEPEGYQRAFVDEGEPMARLLYQAIARGVFPAYAAQLLGVLSSEIQAVTPSKSPPTGGLIEPLSERELEVLQLIAEGLSNAEIAGRLYVSLSTVKGHTTNIFGKLDVKNRTQAVARARSLGILAS